MARGRGGGRKGSWTLFPVTLFGIWLLTIIRMSEGGPKPKAQAEGEGDLNVAYSIPTVDENLRSLDVVVSLANFKGCNIVDCQEVCGTKDPMMAYCDKHNKKLCMCDPQYFHPSEMPGNIYSVDREDFSQKNCSIACNKRNSYARIWDLPNGGKYCLCLSNQVTVTGLTLCDPLAKADVCRAVCQTDFASCSFNGGCLCRTNWEAFFNMALPNARKETPEEDAYECLSICTSYHHDYIGRIYDTKLNKKKQQGKNKTKNVLENEYRFREKFCACGEWLDVSLSPQSKAVIEQGFQLCTGLRCKQRCGMDEAICEPKYRRACLCPREAIIINNHLWSRLPTHGETRCFETCAQQGYDARVIEWNPFLVPEDMFSDPRYRKSTFQFLYDGKFCHCIKSQIDMHQYRPCTDEFCRIICGHYAAECDKRTRRNCFCNTHQLAHNLGRRPDPGEVNCDVSCRFGLFDAKLLEIKWENTAVDSWGVKISKYCTCIQRISPAGLSHCDPINDECPVYCGTPKSYCTREKYCYCGVVSNLLSKNPMIRIPNGKEADECGEKCISWLWPMTEDGDSKPYIYDEALATCSELPDSCPKIDPTPWKLEKPGSLTASGHVDSLEADVRHRRFCLCVKTASIMYKPGNRFIAHIEPERASTDVPCFGNHTCAITGKSLHIVS